MDFNIKYELDKNFIVAKDNKLIYSKYDMTAMEQKLILVLASTIKPDDDNVNMVSFRVKDLAELMNVTPELFYKELPKTTKKIMSRVIEIKNDDTGDWEMLHIISYAKYEKKNGLITLEFHEKIKPYLLQLKELYTSYRLDNILNLNSKYAIRMYELLKGNSFRKNLLIELENFKELFMLNKKSYDNFSNINLKVIKPALIEIEDKTDLKVTFTPKKVGKKVHSLYFTIEPKKIIKPKQKTEAIKKKLKFDNFTGRIYDYDDLEKKLLGWE